MPRDNKRNEKSGQIIGAIEVGSVEHGTIEAVLIGHAENPDNPRQTALTLLRSAKPTTIDGKTDKILSQAEIFNWIIDLPKTIFEKAWIKEFDLFDATKPMDFTREAVTHHRAEFGKEIRHLRSALRAKDITPKSDEQNRPNTDKKNKP